ncbi:hypothetical protein A2757_02495 [Candidatus Giovannonibacteria bacterium RIFCSPHIGHO2_01_FULL_48_47]|nr:MAG: hypothetical protein A2757_02495 [Candidatus Giovannonibacteria bacterium RIFCSPHIGHO2_01_FULL_48_47]OGF67657.1 MAG: hypothetical protein A3D61_01770 [Candidatus Giovannonibacteria bacterium RIFCSPHIGHO2_02_FULL_48_15]OGF89830.1 MAG: hypothetical protein A3B26_03230 [Candidatus Giovannonibacteria bacterium RIFCSPLOWO2_01_FULL_48_47]OGF95295.1 MAG: hypothetical protein A2433_01020 [Candidatus Giovannonibacteria bacterium RIFOXYC1_FULL_48_8]OGF95808.1 MAG: hypothetical protein A2613_04095
MNKSAAPYIKVSRTEYLRLRKLQKYFETFWNYLSHLRDIQEAREDIKAGRTIAQEKLFRKLGI